MEQFTPIADVNLKTVGYLRGLLDRVPVNGTGVARALLVGADLLEAIATGNVIMCYKPNDTKENN